MRINTILPALGHSGGVQMATEYLNYFVEQGNDVVCYVPFTGAYYGWKKFLFPKAIYRLLNSKDLQGKWIQNKFVIKFVPYINNLWVRNADVTIATSWLTSYWVYKLNRQKGKKVYFIQDYEVWGSSKENLLVRKSYNLPFDLRISVSTMLHDRLLKENNVSSTIICNGIKSKYIRETKKQFINKKLVIGFPYRERRGEKKDIKNCDFALKALKKYTSLSNVEVRAFGFNKPQNWDDKFSFLTNPLREDLFNWYDYVDIFYVPSLYEGWGLPAMEAMARGCVVLAADTGCFKEFGKDKNNFYELDNMKSKEELFQALNNLINNQNLREKISLNAISTVKGYSFEREAKLFLSSLIKLYKS